MVKKPWLARTLPMPPQVGQVEGLVPGLAPVPVQPSQVTQVGAAFAAGAPGAAAAPATHELAEQIIEDVRHRGGEIRSEPVAMPTPTVECGVTELIVSRPLLRI